VVSTDCRRDASALGGAVRTVARGFLLPVLSLSESIGPALPDSTEKSSLPLMSPLRSTSSSSSAATCAGGGSSPSLYESTKECGVVPKGRVVLRDRLTFPA
jgi:hypothetical protein